MKVGDSVMSVGNYTQELAELGRSCDVNMDIAITSYDRRIICATVLRFLLPSMPCHNAWVASRYIHATAVALSLASGDREIENSTASPVGIRALLLLLLLLLIKVR